MKGKSAPQIRAIEEIIGLLKRERIGTLMMTGKTVKVINERN